MFFTTLHSQINTQNNHIINDKSKCCKISKPLLYQSYVNSMNSVNARAAGRAKCGSILKTAFNTNGSYYRKQYQLIPQSINICGSREGAPGGSRMPITNKF